MTREYSGRRRSSGSTSRPGLLFSQGEAPVQCPPTFRRRQLLSMALVMPSGPWLISLLAWPVFYTIRPEFRYTAEFGAASRWIGLARPACSRRLSTAESLWDTATMHTGLSSDRHLCDDLALAIRQPATKSIHAIDHASVCRYLRSFIFGLLDPRASSTNFHFDHRLLAASASPVRRPVSP